MDFPVTAEFVDTANAAQLHAECRGDSPDWPASFVLTEDGWVYRIDDPDEKDDRAVVVDADLVKSALADHVPVTTVSTPAEKLASVGLTPADLLALVETAQAEKAG